MRPSEKLTHPSGDTFEITAPDKNGDGQLIYNGLVVGTVHYSDVLGILYEGVRMTPPEFGRKIREWLGQGIFKAKYEQLKAPEIPKVQ